MFSFAGITHIYFIFAGGGSKGRQPLHLYGFELFRQNLAHLFLSHSYDGMDRS